MKIQVLEVKQPNSGILHPQLSKTIQIINGRYIENDNTSHPLISENEKYFKRIYCLKYSKKYIYYFTRFGQKESQHGFHIGLNWFENQKFLFLQKKHWLQKEENIRYLINIMFLAFGVYISLKKI